MVSLSLPMHFVYFDNKIYLHELTKGKKLIISSLIQMYVWNDECYLYCEELKILVVLIQNLTVLFYKIRHIDWMGAIMKKWHYLGLAEKLPTFIDKRLPVRW